MNFLSSNIVKIILGTLLLFGSLFLIIGGGNAEPAMDKGRPRVHLSEYGSLSPDSIQNTLLRAVNDLDGKNLVIPGMRMSLDKIDVLGKHDFEMEFLPGGEVNCEQFRLIDCQNFTFHGLNLKGTKEKFAIFDVIGYCFGFSIYDCHFDSEKDDQGNNTFYGIHVRSNWYMPNRTYANSPHNFKIYGNTIRNTRYDGILVHANCSDFLIEDNIVEDAKCIGIEIEGRYGGWKNTTVQPCKKAIIRNNKMNRCGDWGILLMWSDSTSVINNVSKGAYGSFLSIGCKNLEVRSNVLEGMSKGFEVSQEFYKIENGINEDVVIEDNQIIAKPRDNNRGALDIRHAKNVVVKDNKVNCLFKPNAACVSVASSKNIKVFDNEFYAEKGMPYRTMLDEVVDPETGQNVNVLRLSDVDLRNNKYTKVEDKHSVKVVLDKRSNCYIK